MNKYIFLIICALAQCNMAFSQNNAIFKHNIQTLQVKAGGEWGEAPIFLLNHGYVEISFDDLQHRYMRYSYTITHCNADWEPSSLNINEYMEGFADNLIEDYEQSMNTTMEYNHYSFELPNKEVRLLVSGNYIVNIFEDGNDEPVARACFSIIEPKVGIDIEVTGNTDIDTWNQHQQLSFSINYSGYSVRNPIEEFIPVITQNHRWDNKVTDIKPTFTKINKVIYEHNRNLIFEAGNEYRRFEILDEYVPTMRVDRMEYFDPYYHATLVEDNQRTNYLFDRDQAGRFYVRNKNNDNIETESDYFYTHFTLKMPRIAGGEVYLNGDLTNGSFDEEYRMKYNDISHAYEIVLPLKQGSYNYQYLFVRDGEDIGHTLQTEGDFHQTENEYYVYVYHRPFGQRYDRLIGFSKINSEQ